MEIRFDEKVVRTIVHALNKATTVDVPMAYNENNRATNNCFPAMRIDIINQNIFTMLNFDGVQVHRFSRHGWKVCMIIDNNSSNAYFVLSERNLKSINAKKGRTWPHYLQSLLHKFHKDYPPRVIQESFLPMVSPFDDETYEKDVEMIIGKLIENLDSWHLYVIAYERMGNELSSVKQYFLTPSFEIIDEKDLAQYIVPDYFAVVKPIDETPSATSEPEKADELVKLKPKLKPRSDSEDTDDPTVKPNEYADVG